MFIFFIIFFIFLVLIYFVGFYFNNNFILCLISFFAGISAQAVLNFYYSDFLNNYFLKKLEGYSLTKLKLSFFFFWFFILLFYLGIYDLIIKFFEKSETYYNNRDIEMIYMYLNFCPIIIVYLILTVNSKKNINELIKASFLNGMLICLFFGLIIGYFMPTAYAMDDLSNQIWDANKNLNKDHYYNYYTEISDFDLPAIVLKNAIGKSMKPLVNSYTYKTIEILFQITIPQPAKILICGSLKFNRVFWNNYPITSIIKYSNNFYKKKK